MFNHITSEHLKCCHLLGQFEPASEHNALTETVKMAVVSQENSQTCSVRRIHSRLQTLYHLSLRWCILMKICAERWCLYYSAALISSETKWSRCLESLIAALDPSAFTKTCPLFLKREFNCPHEALTIKHSSSTTESLGLAYQPLFGRTIPLTACDCPHL